MKQRRICDGITIPALKFDTITQILNSLFLFLKQYIIFPSIYYAPDLGRLE
jgi:hypothetical protein